MEAIQPGENYLHDPGKRDQSTAPNTYCQALICSANVSSNKEHITNTNYQHDDPRTELNSHANMPVLGKNCLILSDTGKLVDVNPFTPDYESMTVQIVDAAIQYDCLYEGKSYVLVIKNSLYVPSMTNNLIPLFIMRKAGVFVNDIPKIHLEDSPKMTMQSSSLRPTFYLYMECFHTSQH